MVAVTAGSKIVSRKTMLGIGMVIVPIVLVFTIYSGSLEGSFVFDDFSNIYRNPFIRLQHLSLEGIQDAITKSVCRNRPVANISFALNYYLQGYDVSGYHLVNVFVHITAGFLLFVLLRVTVRLSRGQASDRLLFGENHLAPAIYLGVLLWLVHPVNTQAVSYIVQRMTSMSAMFYLLSMVLYVNGRMSEGRGRRWVFWTGSVFAGLMAMGSKEIAITLPVFIFLYEWYFFRDLDKGWLGKQALRIAVIGGLVTLLVLVYSGLHNPFDIILNGYDKRDFTLSQRLMTELRVVVHYVSLLVYPHPSRLNLDYDFPLSYGLFKPVTTVLSLASLAAILAFAAFLARGFRIISFAVLWFLGNLVLESTVIPLELVYEHRLYLPSMFIVPVFVLALFRYIGHRHAWAVATLLLVCLFSFWTYQRNRVWADEELILLDSISKSPYKARPYNNLGTIISDKGDQDRAIKLFSKAIQLKPDYVDALNNIGAAYVEKGEPERAVRYYEEALKVQPDYINAHFNLALCLDKLGRIDESIAQFEKVVQVDGTRTDVYNNIGAAYLKKGSKADAYASFRKVLPGNPQFAAARYNYGNALSWEGRVDDAIREYETAVLSAPEYLDAHMNLGVALAAKGRFAEAAGHFEKVLQMDPSNQVARLNLEKARQQEMTLHASIDGVRTSLDRNPHDFALLVKLGDLYRAGGDLALAEESYRAALSVKPHYIQALYGIAMTDYLRGNYDEAAGTFKHAIELYPDNADLYYNLGCILSKQGKIEESVSWLKQAKSKGFDRWSLLKTDPDLQNIRNTQFYIEMTTEE